MIFFFFSESVITPVLLLAFGLKIFKKILIRLRKSSERESKGDKNENQIRVIQGCFKIFKDAV